MYANKLLIPYNLPLAIVIESFYAEMIPPHFFLYGFYELRLLEAHAIKSVSMFVGHITRILNRLHHVRHRFKIKGTDV